MTYSSSHKSSLDLIKVLNGAPTLGNQTMLSHIKIEHVHSVIYSFHFSNLEKREREEGERGRKRKREAEKKSIKINNCEFVEII